MQRKSRKKSVAAVRLLREWYDESPVLTPGRLQRIVTHVNATCNANLTCDEVTVHFADKAYRERLKRRVETGYRRSRRAPKC